ncbi:MAG TPA: hypothetical protein VJ739_16205 [Gemmataceae bacterium]|nr:hypothetical protein [Gemmataceae bacterium]
MRTITATAVIPPDHTLTVRLPEDIPPGTRTVLVVLEDGGGPPPAPAPLALSPHPVGPADPSCTYRREEIYGDDGR